MGEILYNLGIGVLIAIFIFVALDFLGINRYTRRK